MDFMSLLDTANKNAKNVSKKLDDLKTEVDYEKRAELKRIEEERVKKMEIIKRRKSLPKPVKEESKFVIPKKKKDTESDDKAKVLSYLAKKSEEERQLLMQKKAEKERLIKLRLQAHGGKATKKMAKNFGMSAIDLQIRFGHDVEHVERLQKQKWKEEEEQDRLATQYRDGVYKALAQKKKIDEQTKKSGVSSSKQTQHSSNKSNSQMSSSSRDQSGSNRSLSDQLKRPKLNHAVPDRKIKTAPAIAFSELMKAAQDIAQGKDTKLIQKSIEQTSHKLQRDDTANRTTPSSFAKKNRVDVENKQIDGFLKNVRASEKSHEKLLQSGSTKKVESRLSQANSSDAKLCLSSSKSIKNSSCEDVVVKDRKDQKGRSKKGVTPPFIPQAVPGKRYLPGDIRYKQITDVANGTQTANSAERSYEISSRQSLTKKHGIMHVKDRPGSSKLMPSQTTRVDSKRTISTEKASPRDRSHIYSQIKQQAYPNIGKNEKHPKQSISNDHRAKLERHRGHHEYDKKSEHRHDSYKRSYSYDDLHDEEYEDEYDSDLEDFIDDSGLDMEELSRQEFEETLKMVNPKYNKKKWRERERTISLKDMHADYRTIAREEARSARIGLIEDLHEATKGKSEAL